MPTEFELSFSGSSRNVLDAIAVLAEHNINLNTVATARTKDKYVIKFVAGSDDEVRASFLKADLPFKERRVLAVEMPNRPGQWLRVARALVDGGIDIEASYMLAMAPDSLRFVFAVSDYEKARSICLKLGDCSVE